MRWPQGKGTDKLVGIGSAFTKRRDHLEGREGAVGHRINEVGGVNRGNVACLIVEEALDEVAGDPPA